MSNRLTYSRIDDHNIHPPTDNLYNPLRAILEHPEIAISHRENINDAVRKSRVTHDFRYLQGNEASQIKSKTFIPVDKPLKPTHHLEKVQGTKFIAVDAQQKVLGPPISPEEMQRIRSQGLRQEKIVYDFDQVEEPSLKLQSPVPFQPKKSKYRCPPVDEYEPKQNYKYNLFSMIDEPANKIKQFGCGACTCPGNEIIASRNEPQSLSWLK